MGYQVKYYPVDNHLFVVTCANQVIYQWDTRSGDVVQEYNHHLGPVNAISFYDEGRKFVSTSDDAKILCWEWDIPVRYCTLLHVIDRGLIDQRIVHVSMGWLWLWLSLCYVVAIFHV